jgi:hypothetical protein
MVTKPTGRPRGRPRKPRPPPREGPGRPPTPLNKDPLRYHLALMDALLELDRIGRSTLSVAPTRKVASLRTCSWIVAAWDIGLEVQGPFFGRRAVRDVTLFGRPDDPKSFVGFSRRTKAAPGAAWTIRGRAETLRKKHREASAPEETNWRGNVAACFVIALLLPSPMDAKKAEDAKSLVLKYAERANESAFAIKVIFPMIAAKITSPE